jgi:hypothetical protein
MSNEPVAWMHVQGSFEEPSLRQLDEDDIGRGWRQYPLYTHPPQRKPLTDEEIRRIYETSELAGSYFPTATEKAIAVARAIERAHGIGRSKE